MVGCDGDGGNDRRWNFMINLHKSCVGELGFELATLGSAVRLVTDCDVYPGREIKLLMN